MLIAKIIVAALLSLLGTILFYIIGLFSFGLVGSYYELTSCFVGSFFSSLLFNDIDKQNFKLNIAPSVKIVFTTFLTIAIGHAIEQRFIRQVSIGFEPFGMFFWATVITSWWLIPLTSFVLTLLNRISSKQGER